MPTKFSDKDNLEFVCSCIKHSKNGICNFEAVSKALRLTSKYAAVCVLTKYSGTTNSEQRFSRLMRQHGVTTGLRGMTDKVKKRKKQEDPDGWDTFAGIDPKLGRPRKKRKLRQVLASIADDDDDEPLVKGEVKPEDDVRVKSELGNIDHGGSAKWPGSDGHDDDDDIMIIGASEKTAASLSIATAEDSPGLPEMPRETSRIGSRQISHDHNHHINDILPYTTLVPDPVHAWYYHQYQPNLPHDVYHHQQHHTPATSENHCNHAGSHEPEEHLDRDRNGRS
ncbi:hypothetical protein PGQ11_009270 [Apiospora arundinis]|uniref:Myb-like DNA-binding domain-containing protein n=1 Tax=Apiospora arundinis TaxID=335852 RepID=A0ABR2IHI6_9PEZI